MSRISGNLIVTGNLKVGSFDFPSGMVGDNEMNPASPIDVDKQVHQYTHTYQQDRASAVATARTALFSAYADGTVVGVQCGVTLAAVGDSTVTVDVYKNGVSVLSAPVAIDSGDAAFDTLFGTLSSPGYSAGQVVEVVVTATVGTGTLPKGLYVTVVVNEDAA